MQYAELDETEEEEPLPKVLTDLLEKLQEEIELPHVDESELEPMDGYDFNKFKADYTEVVEDVISKSEKYQNKLHKLRDIQDAIMVIRDPKYLEKFLEILSDFRETENIEETRKEFVEATEKFHQMKKTASLSGDTDMGNKYTCFLCLKNGINMCFNPCGHVVCDQCHMKATYNECPFCRSDIACTTKLFISN